MGAINLNYPDGWLKFFVEVDEPHIDMEVINAISAIAEGEGEDSHCISNLSEKPTKRETDDEQKSEDWQPVGG